MKITESVIARIARRELKSGGSSHYGGGGFGGGITLDTVWQALDSDTNEQINASHIATALSAYAKKTSIPTKVSQLTNDLNFISSADKLMPNGTITFGGGYLQFRDKYQDEGSNNAREVSNPTGDWYHHLIMNHANNGGYYVDFATCFHSDQVYYRRIVKGSTNSWVRIIDSSNIGNQTVKYAGGASSANFMIVGTESDLPRLSFLIDNVNWANISMDGNGSLHLRRSFATDGNYTGLNVGGFSAYGNAGISGDLSLGGVLYLKENAYNGPTGAHGLNCRNSDIVNVNSIYTNDLSDDWSEGFLFKRTNNNWDSLRAANGNWYFGANNSDAGATVRAANFYATGSVTALSDERLKHVEGDTVIDLDMLASAPSVKFRWRDREDHSLHVGTLAQAWQKILPEVVYKQEDGTLTMDYSTAALVAVISLAREVKDLKKEITILKMSGETRLK